MTNSDRKIQVNGMYFTESEIISLCKEKLASSKIPLWEKEIYCFLQDWFSPLNTITVTTSGSTGVPKQIILKKTHMIASAKATLSFFSLKRGDNAWLCLPINYIAGKMMVVRAIVGELNLLFSEPSSNPIIDNIRRISFAAMVPNQVHKLLKSPRGVKQLLEIDNLLIGGSGITNDLERSLADIPAINSWHSYGMTETITHIAIRKISIHSKSCSYNPLSGIKVSINDDDKLIIDAPSIGVNNMLTNDIAKTQDDGSFIIVGRADNVIISGGVKFFPESIEERIKEYIDASFFVGGLPDEQLGERITLFVEDVNTDNDVAESLRTRLKHVLHKFEIPKQIVYLPEFFRTESGKIRRARIIEYFVNSKSKGLNN